MNSRADRGKGLPGLLVGAVLAISTLLAGIVVFSSAACSSDSLRKGLSGPAASTPEDLLAELKNDKARIDQVSDEMMRRIETFNASRRPGERTIQFSEVFYEELTPEQRDVLNTLLAEEKDVSYKSLIQGIIKDRDTIKALQDKVLHLEQSLPDKFVVAAKGDSHHDLAMDYLQTEAKVDKEKAKKLLAEVDQTDELVAGNKVWFFYDPERDSFRTYVTQGTAGQTPLVVRRALKRQLVTERDAAQAKVNDLEQTKAQLETQISGLNNDIQILGDRRTELETEVAGLQQNKTQLENKVTDLSADLAFRQNSLFYHAASEQELKDKGVLSSVLKRVQDVKGVEYEQALDLRQSTTLTLTPGTYGLSHIKSVRLLPSIFQEGRDFTVETSEDGTAAKLNILDPSMFRGKEVLVSVKG
jgi:hypothetical protein